MSKDKIQLLIGAMVDPNAISNIKKQIKDLQKDIGKVDLGINTKGVDKATSHLEGINKQLLEMTHKAGIDAVNDDLSKMVMHFKASEAEAGRLIKTLKDGYIATKEVIDLDGHVQAEKERVKTLQERIDLYQKKNLKDIDIFAEQNRGMYDKTELEAVRSKIEGLSATSGDAERAMAEATIEMGHMRKEAGQSSNVLARMSENFLKFTRFYIVGQAVVSFKQSISDGIRSIKELDADLTQVSIITGQTREETKRLTDTYSDLAQELRKTVSEVSEVNTELIRQGLSVEEAEERLKVIMKLSSAGTMETGQTLKVITSAVNALGEESEHTANVILRASQISASSADDVGEALTKTASSAKSTGMGITELSALISGLVEVTQESPSSLGNSIKTLLSRFNRVNEETGEVNESLNDVQTAFESVGITFLDSENQIRPVYDLLTDLSTVWDTLDNNTRMYISTQAAGVRQQNRFLAIMDNFNRVQEINNELKDSGNVLNESYAVYLDSVEASANRLKASLEGLWIDTIDSDSIKNVYDAGSAIVGLIDRIGLLESAIIALSFAVLLGSENWRKFSRELSVGALLGGLSGLAEGIRGITLETKVLGMEMQATGVKAAALKVGIGLLQGALTLGLSVAISAAIGWFTKLIGRMSELRTSSEELVQTFNSNTQANDANIKRLYELEDAYKDIESGIINVSSLNEEERTTIEELIQINPTLVRSYDERGNAIVDTTEKIDDMIEKLEEANRLEHSKLSLGIEDSFEVAQEDAEGVREEIERINNEIYMARDHVEESAGYAFTSGSIAQLTRNKQRLLDIEVEEGELTKTQTARLHRLNNNIQEQEIRIAELNQEMDIQVDILKQLGDGLQGQFQSYPIAIKAYDDMSDAARHFTEEYIETIDVLAYENSIDIKKEIDEFIELIGTVNFEHIISEYEHLVEQFMEGEISADEFDESVRFLLSALFNIEEIPDDVITQLFKDSSGIERMVDETERLTYSTEDMIEVVGDAADEYDLFNIALEELQDEGELSRDTLEKLLAVFPNLIEMTGLQEDALRDLMLAGQAERRAKVQDEVAKANQVITSTLQRLGAYEEEAKALKALEEAQKTVDLLDTGHAHPTQDSFSRQARDKAAGLSYGLSIIQRAKSQIAGIKKLESWFDESDTRRATRSSSSSGGGSRSTPRSRTGSSTSSRDTTRYREEADAYADINHELERNSDLLSKNKILQDIAGDNATEKIKLMEEEVKLNKERQESLHKLNTRRREEMVQLEKSLSKHFKFEGEGDNRVITNLEAVKGKTEDVAEEFDRYIELQTSLLPQTGQEWWNVENAILSTEEQIVDTQLAHSKWWIARRVSLDDWGDYKQQGDKELADNEVAAWKRVKAYMEEYYRENIISHKKYKDTMIELNDKIAAAQLKALDDRTAHSKRYINRRNFYDDWSEYKQQGDEDLVDNEIAAWERIKAYTRQAYKDNEISHKKYKDRILEYDRNIASEQKRIADEAMRDYEAARSKWLRSKNAELQEQRDRLTALDTIQEAIVDIIRQRGEEEKKALDKAHSEEMESLEDRHSKRKELYQEELDEFNKMIQGKIDALEEQYDEEDYLEELNEEREKAAEIQREIDILSLDDSLTARNKTIELREKLRKQEEKIAKLQQKRERDIVRKSLEDQLKDKEKEIRDKEDISDDYYESERTRLEDDYKINKEYLEQKYSDEKVYAEARESIMRGTVEVAKGQFEDIYDAYVNFEDKFGKGMGILGDIIKDDFVAELEKARQAIEELEKVGGRLERPRDDYTEDDYPEPKPDPAPRPEKPKPLPPREEPVKEEITHPLYKRFSHYQGMTIGQLKGMFEIADEGYDASTTEAGKNKYLDMAEAAHRYANLARELGFIITSTNYFRSRGRGYRHGGKITETGTVISPFHGTKSNPEWIFNDGQLKNIIESTAKLSLDAMVPKILNLPRQVSSTSDEYNVHLTVEGNMDKDMLPKVKRMVEEGISEAQSKKVSRLKDVGVRRRL